MFTHRSLRNENRCSCANPLLTLENSVERFHLFPEHTAELGKGIIFTASWWFKTFPSLPQTWLTGAHTHIHRQLAVQSDCIVPASLYLHFKLAKSSQRSCTNLDGFSHAPKHHGTMLKPCTILNQLASLTSRRRGMDGRKLQSHKCGISWGGRCEHFPPFLPIPGRWVPFANTEAAHFQPKRTWPWTVVGCTLKSWTHGVEASCIRWIVAPSAVAPNRAEDGAVRRTTK